MISYCLSILGMGVSVTSTPPTYLWLQWPPLTQSFSSLAWRLVGTTTTGHRFCGLVEKGNAAKSKDFEKPGNLLKIHELCVNYMTESDVVLGNQTCSTFVSQKDQNISNETHVEFLAEGQFKQTSSVLNSCSAAFLQNLTKSTKHGIHRLFDIHTNSYCWWKKCCTTWDVYINKT